MSVPSEVMMPLPNESLSKAELIQKHINELTQLKRQVLQKRHDLRALGAKDDHITTDNIIKEDKRKAREAAKEKAKQEKAASISAPPPAESPFIDPNAPKVPVSKPIPIPVQAPDSPQEPPVVNKPPTTTVLHEPVKAAIPAPVRISHGATWF
jgi:hypothetical protein